MNKIQWIGIIGLILVVIIMCVDSKGATRYDNQTTAGWQPSTCTLNQSDWPCLETEGCF